MATKNGKNGKLTKRPKDRPERFLPPRGSHAAKVFLTRGENGGIAIGLQRGRHKMIITVPAGTPCVEGESLKTLGQSSWILDPCSCRQWACPWCRELAVMQELRTRYASVFKSVPPVT